MEVRHRQTLIKLLDPNIMGEDLAEHFGRHAEIRREDVWWRMIATLLQQRIISSPNIEND
jgi:hypothetical protein